MDQIDDALLDHVNPELRPSLEAMLRQIDSRTPLRACLPEMRAMMESFGGEPAADVAYERCVVPAAGERPPVVVYVIDPRPNLGGRARPAILHMHGGGFVMGCAAAQIAELQGYARALDCVIVTVDYRLAPETTYRGSIEDTYAALKWLHDNAPELGVDPSRIAVMGESAGGGHAAILAIVARDRGEIPVAFQCLIAPMLDDRTGAGHAVPPHLGTFLWKREDN